MQYARSRYHRIMTTNGRRMKQGLATAISAIAVSCVLDQYVAIKIY